MLNLDDLDDKKWSGVQWAVVNCHADVVRMILEKQEEIKLKNQFVVDEEKVKKVEEIKDYKKNEFDDIFKKPPNSSSLGKYNALHWAAYKGFEQIASILIKFGYDPLEIDNVGNTSIHQAAASNKLEVFKIFMGLGLDLEIKNDRGHTAFDLTANKSIKNLIQKTLSIKTCQLCPKHFDFFNKRYQCSINEEVICKNCSVSEYCYGNVNSKEKDILKCLCKTCNSLIMETENKLRSSIKSNDLDEITKNFKEIKEKQINICIKLDYETELNINRLEREKKILAHLNSLKEVENHKTIEKSVFILEEMIKNANEHKIELDSHVIEKSQSEKNRLLSEKELRKVLSNLSVDLASNENLINLEEKINTASACGVEHKFVSEAEELKRKIKLNLLAKELLDIFCEYPIREYPQVEVIDPKKKSKLN
jgi:hypothetical protein